MKTHFTVLGLAFWVTLAPMAAFAQGLGQVDSSFDGMTTSLGGNAPAANLNPFTGAAGADKFYQDNSLTGAAQSNTMDTASSTAGSGSAIPAGADQSLGDDAAASNANPFAAAAGANKFYRDNSLTGASQGSNPGALGGADSAATSWATTP